MSQNIKNEKGAALITVLIAVMMLSLMIFEFQYASNVERRLAYNGLNQMKAYYLAKSGANIALLRVGLYARLSANNGLKNKFKNVDLGTYLDKIWQLPLPPFPPDEETIKQMETKVQRDGQEETLKTTKVDDGYTAHTIQGESAKINLNSMVISTEQERSDFDPRDSTKASVQNLTAHMLYNLIEGFIDESEKPYEEFGNINPEQVIFDIVDWISPGDERILGGNKDSAYEAMEPQYSAKRNRFYTVEELKMVASINDRLYEKLEPHVTVYSDASKINLNSARDDVIKAIYPDFTDDDLRRISDEKAERGGSWGTIASFIAYIRDELGHSGFETKYNDPSNYPFDLGSKSFLIESTGYIERSASTIQKVIRVGVGLVRSSDLKPLQGVTTKAACDKKGNQYWFDRNTGRCIGHPKTRAQCENPDVFPGAKWIAYQGQNCCKLPGYRQPICAPAATSGTQQTAAQKQAQQDAAKPNAMRIFYWTES